MGPFPARIALWVARTPEVRWVVVAIALGAFAVTAKIGMDYGLFYFPIYNYIMMCTVLNIGK